MEMPPLLAEEHPVIFTTWMSIQACSAPQQARTMAYSSCFQGRKGPCRDGSPGAQRGALCWQAQC